MSPDPKDHHTAASRSSGRGARGKHQAQRYFETENREPLEERLDRRSRECEPDDDGGYSGHSATPARAVTPTAAQARSVTPATEDEAEARA